MGGKNGSGAGNVNSFNEFVHHKNIPHPSSLTYQGLFNDNMFSINGKEKKQLLSVDLNYCVVNNPIDKGKRDIYLGALIKSKLDGIGARRPIDMVISLDISGSMNSNLGNSKDSCLTLAKNAIMKLADRLNAEDRLGLSTFDDKGYTLFDLSKINEVENFNEIISKIKTQGGTTLHAGFKESYDIMKRNMRENTEKRIVFITDMNSFNDSKFEQYLKDAANERIYTTIIGIGMGFNTQLTEIISKIKGMNYFSAVKEEHLNKIIVEQFDYNFFPVAFDVNMEFMSGDFKVKQCIGTGFKELKDKVESESDWKTSEHYLNDKTFKRQIEFLLLDFNRMKKRLPKPVLAKFCDYLRYNKKTICHINSTFSCVLDEAKDAQLQMEGGLVLIKLGSEYLSERNSDRRGIISLTYNNLDGNAHSDSYTFSIDPNNMEMDKNMNYFSGRGIKEGMVLYYYAKYMRIIMKIHHKMYKNQKENRNDELLQKENLEKMLDSVKNFIDEYEASDNMKTDILGKMSKMYDLIIEGENKKKEAQIDEP